ncbi:MAG: Dyp-type peroxidase, partial [Bacteroidota bacterium]
RDKGVLEETIDKAREKYRGVVEHKRLDTFSFRPAREHFGFRDGIAQPIIEGLSRTGPPENTLPAGEFILGYKNAYGKVASGPTVALKNDPKGILPRVAIEAESHNNETPTLQELEAADFGRNGSYLVFRQMKQDVKGFWNFIAQASKEKTLKDSQDPRIKLAAKMVGRWPNGAPLTECPVKNNANQENNNNFNYAGDLDGSRCPIGAHIRRTNPRDALEGTFADSIKTSNRHRLLRRGRPYGKPLSSKFDIDEILAAKDNHEEVGLHFICLNADLGRQFEFVQNTWVNNTKFAGLYSDSDPLIGNQHSDHNTFTIQRAPIRERITEMKSFVNVRGGAYFFLPGLRALRYLASL